MVRIDHASGGPKGEGAEKALLISVPTRALIWRTSWRDSPLTSTIRSCAQPGEINKTKTNSQADFLVVTADLNTENVVSIQRCG